MKNFKNKFIFLILLLIGGVLGLESYSMYTNNDTNSYVLLINGTGYLDNNLLNIKERKIVKVGNTIKTVGEDSIVVLEWGDNSITRLGGNTEIYINENFVSSDLTKLQISFKLLNGKTWTNLVSLLVSDSYFKQYVDDLEAGVRGTVFEVNKEKDYIYVQDHEVFLKNIKSGKEVLVGENNPISIKTFSFIKLQNFISTLKDNAWIEINKKLDSEFILNLQSSINNLNDNNPINSIIGIFSKKQEILNSINSGENINTLKEKITNLNQSDKIKLFNELLSKYQNLNYASSSDNNYNKKIYYKEILLQTSTDIKNTESIVKSTLYDINDMIESNNISKLKESVGLLVNNKEIIRNLDINFNSYVNLSLIPESLKESMIKSFEPLNDIFKINLDFSILNQLEETAKGKLDEFLDENLGSLIDSFKNINK